jgi:poly(3-hydroxybutyrate) depolymerase
MRPPAPLASLLRALLAFALIIGAALPANAGAAAAGDADAGRGRFMFSGWDGPPLPVWYQLPGKVTPETSVVIVMHGVNRDADRYRDEWAGIARTYRLIVIVPEFSRADFPGSDGYNTGYFTAADGAPRPRRLWSFAAIEPLFDAVRVRFGTAAERYTLYGHSAGAQFVHRFVMFMPEARIAQAIAANAGWYTMPDSAAAFPYGTQGAPITETELKAALAKPMTVLLGTADTDTADPDLRTTPEANLQGPHRLARGQAFFAMGRARAEQWAVPFGWRIEFVPDVGHSNGLMAEAAAKLIAARRES